MPMIAYNSVSLADTVNNKSNLQPSQMHGGVTYHVAHTHATLQPPEYTSRGPGVVPPCQRHRYKRVCTHSRNHVPTACPPTASTTPCTPVPAQSTPCTTARSNMPEELRSLHSWHRSRACGNSASHDTPHAQRAPGAPIAQQTAPSATTCRPSTMHRCSASVPLAR